MLIALFRIVAAAGTILLGAALVIAPIAAFGDRMTTVSALGLAGMAFLLVAWLLRRHIRALAQSDGSGEE